MAFSWSTEKAIFRKKKKSLFLGAVEEIFRKPKKWLFRLSLKSDFSDTEKVAFT